MRVYAVIRQPDEKINSEQCRFPTLPGECNSISWLCLDIWKYATTVYITRPGFLYSLSVTYDSKTYYDEMASAPPGYGGDPDRRIFPDPTY